VPDRKTTSVRRLRLLIGLVVAFGVVLLAMRCIGIFPSPPVRVLPSEDESAAQFLQDVLTSQPDLREQAVAAQKEATDPKKVLGLFLKRSPDLAKGIHANKGRSYLHQACMDGNLYVTKLLLDHGADVNATNAQPAYGLTGTPLHYAAMSGQLDVARLLLKRGADPNATDDYSSTPLHKAVKGPIPAAAPMAELLLEHGADIHAIDGSRRAPLQLIEESEYGVFYGDVKRVLRRAGDK